MLKSEILETPGRKALDNARLRRRIPNVYAAAKNPDGQGPFHERVTAIPRDRQDSAKADPRPLRDHYPPPSPLNAATWSQDKTTRRPLQSRSCGSRIAGRRGKAQLQPARRRKRVPTSSESRRTISAWALNPSNPCVPSGSTGPNPSPQPRSRDATADVFPSTGKSKKKGAKTTKERQHREHWIFAVFASTGGKMEASCRHSPQRQHGSLRGARMEPPCRSFKRIP